MHGRSGVVRWWAGGVVARIFALVDPAMVPVSTTSLLDGRSGTMLRVWWRILTTAGWMECPAGTLIVEDPEVTDDGTLSIGVPGLDVLSSHAAASMARRWCRSAA